MTTWITRRSQFHQTILRQASLLSYVDVFHIMGILFLAVIPLVFLMRRSHALLSASAGD